MVEEGVASAEDIDKAMTLGYGFPMGPLRLTDLVGLDVRLSIAEAPAASAEPIEVVSHCGRRVLLRPGFDADTLRRVLEVLDAGC